MNAAGQIAQIERHGSPFLPTAFLPRP